MHAPARVAHRTYAATAQWHALSGCRSVELLSVVSTTPAWPSAATNATAADWNSFAGPKGPRQDVRSHRTPSNRLAINSGEKCGLGVALAIALTVLSGCRTEDTSHFPLHPGAQWTYAVSETTERGAHAEHFLSIRNVGTDTVADTPLYVRRTSAGTDYYIGRDETGIYRSAKRTIVETAARSDPERRYILKQPLQVGTTWCAPTHPYMVHRIHPYREHYHRSTELPMHYQIASLNEMVTVPAGVFRDCIKVTGEATFALYVDPQSGTHEIPITTAEWYAPGIGLVRLERHESLDTPQFTGGKVVIELTHFAP